MKIVIVGGTGNISTSIVKLLLEQGHEVTCYNRGQRGEVPRGARVLLGDRGDRAEFERVMQAGNFDAAIDMICFNRDDAASSLRAFRGVSHFVQCSTVCTYGVNPQWLPVTEDHPLQPNSGYGRGKVEADNLYLDAYYGEGFPVTIIKPSSTYGPQMGVLRQVAWDFSWVDRVRKGKPILICGEGMAVHQFLHVDDAAGGFAGVLGSADTLGQTYNLVRREFTTWAEYHRLAMKVLGREVELVGITLPNLMASSVPGTDICRDIFVHNSLFSSTKIFRDVPGFAPRVSLEAGLTQVIAALDARGAIPNSDELTWEDETIARLKF